jgi:hypothetical protein
LVIMPIQSISQHPFRSRNAGQGASEGCIHLHTQPSLSSQHIFIAPPSYPPHINLSENKRGKVGEGHSLKSFWVGSGYIDLRDHYHTLDNPC